MLVSDAVSAATVGVHSRKIGAGMGSTQGQAASAIAGARIVAAEVGHSTLTARAAKKAPRAAAAVGVKAGAEEMAARMGAVVVGRKPPQPRPRVTGRKADGLVHAVAAASKPAAVTGGGMGRPSAFRGQITTTGLTAQMMSLIGECPATHEAATVHLCPCDWQSASLWPAAHSYTHSSAALLLFMNAGIGMPAGRAVGRGHAAEPMQTALGVPGGSTILAGGEDTAHGPHALRGGAAVSQHLPVERGAATRTVLLCVHIYVTW